MRAVRLAEFGVENMQVEEIADPLPSTGEVLIATEAATVNPADQGMVSGAMASFLPASITAPYTPGWDLAGRVVALGDGVDHSMLGSKVVGFSPWIEAGRGTQASLVALPIANVAVASDGLSSAHLTTVGLNGLTAWRAVDELSLVDGETLVIAGAAGSVGGFALELAVDRGIRVIAAVYERDRATAMALGASDVAANETGDVASTVRSIVPDGADAFLDTTTSLGNRGLGAVRDGGCYVTTTEPPQAERNITVTKIYGGPDASALATLIKMAETGRLHTPIASEFDVSDARAAYEEFASAPHRGRIVLTF